MLCSKKILRFQKHSGKMISKSYQNVCKIQKYTLYTSFGQFVYLKFCVQALNVKIKPPKYKKNPEP